MEILTQGLTEENSHREINNCPPNSGTMPVVVEHVGTCRMGDLFSVAHYYTQNGDLMADPEMVFLRATGTQDFYPVSYKLDALGVYREGYIFSEDGKTDRIWKSEQADEAVFAGTWMKNIRDQQGLKFVVPAPTPAQDPSVHA